MKFNLAKREKELIKHCCSELTYKEIADKMSVSQRTVDGYRESVFSKLDLKSRTGIVLFAVHQGWLG
ncbi:MAG TPA: LuxR C-terminal-related transcriptional regulator [Chitinophagales bacterium]|nr:LuxR C-terminal-related transcriptional regulator [Chitinophagales bacterium]HNF68874.1 LuxR C-terminal-related transcriptional regulator [Chitinophagales bacterium]HNJ90252.1 LuxR C-terminal-related transcriptional regulator [Chitinophagales bacterium]HNK97437.1 LuxR C-terminal-related transcriptional regulator [Chitinophagales bacterium]HNM09456.1 LuxR C-terminal-related transcriptional regulator [Chitinophagales bacterium]